MHANETDGGAEGSPGNGSSEEDRANELQAASVHGNGSSTSHSLAGKPKPDQKKKKQSAESELHTKVFNSVLTSFKERADLAVQRLDNVGYALFQHCGTKSRMRFKGTLSCLEHQDRTLLELFIMQLSNGQAWQRAAAQAHLRSAPYSFMPAEVKLGCRPAEVIRVLEFLGWLCGVDVAHITQAYCDHVARTGSQKEKQELAVAQQIASDAAAARRAAKRTSSAPRQEGGGKFLDGRPQWLQQMWLGAGEQLMQQQQERLEEAERRRREEWQLIEQAQAAHPATAAMLPVQAGGNGSTQHDAPPSSAPAAPNVVPGPPGSLGAAPAAVQPQDQGLPASDAPSTSAAPAFPSSQQQQGRTASGNGTSADALLPPRRTHRVTKRTRVAEEGADSYAALDAALNAHNDAALLQVVGVGAKRATMAPRSSTQVCTAAPGGSSGMLVEPAPPAAPVDQVSGTLPPIPILGGQTAGM